MFRTAQRRNDVETPFQILVKRMYGSRESGFTFRSRSRVTDKRDLSTIRRPNWTAVARIFGQLPWLRVTDLGCVDPGVGSPKLSEGNLIPVRGKSRGYLLTFHGDQRHCINGRQPRILDFSEKPRKSKGRQQDEGCGT